ncbi:hypothetical protein [Streptomyces sp. NPDC048248]|uniref:hypothetical protein n=1 Tax=Streptomyces sp. NPDC048248 TaxID=3365523 RepID=UPI003713FBA2
MFNEISCMKLKLLRKRLQGSLACASLVITGGREQWSPTGVVCCHHDHRQDVSLTVGLRLTCLLGHLSAILSLWGVGKAARHLPHN